jgi:hypothetical protein
VTNEEVSNAQALATLAGVWITAIYPRHLEYDVPGEMLEWHVLEQNVPGGHTGRVVKFTACDLQEFQENLSRICQQWGPKNDQP